MSRINEPTTDPVCIVSFSEKQKLEQQYRELLFDDLKCNQTEFKAGPYEAHIQFSNFCNMSCIMCWNGKNPPTQKTSPELLHRIGQELGPHLSVITPYSGSEPLVLSWDETRKMALQYGIMLCITTNVQFLDEKKFFELKDIAETLILSIDSHIPGIFEKIRPRGNSAKVFKNLATTAQLCLEHQLECIVNIVFMTDNAAHLADTVAYLADLGIQNVNVIQLLDVNGESGFHDPLIHCSNEYIAWVKKNCLVEAKQKNIRLIWSIAGYQEYDFREEGFVRENTRKEWNDIWDQRLKQTFPGFCRNAYGRLRVDSAGDVAPCCYATQGELSLGNLNKNSFEEIWNGPNARDLRRGMYCGDVPALCQSCRYHDVIDVQSTLPFLDFVTQKYAEDWAISETNEIAATLGVITPVHGSRHYDPPPFRIEKPAFQVQEFFVVVSLGGETDEIIELKIDPVYDEDFVELSLPDDTWNSLKPNTGYWWMLWCIPVGSDQPVTRCRSVQMLIRQQDYPRIPESTLRYLDQGFKPVTDLGGQKELGWQTQGIAPKRPNVAEPGENDLNNHLTPPVDDVKHHDDRHKQSRHLVELSANQNNHRPEPGLHASAEPPAFGFPLLVRKVMGNATKAIFSNRHSVRRNPKLPRGYLDQVKWKSGSLGVIGWMLLDDGAPSTVQLIGRDDWTVIASPVKRPDILSGFPHSPGAEFAGFQATLPDEAFWNETGYEFFIEGKRGNRTIARCKVQVDGRPTGEAAINQLLNLDCGAISINFDDRQFS